MESGSEDEFFDAEDFTPSKSTIREKAVFQVKEKEADALSADIQIKTHDENLKEENFSSEDCENIKLKDKEIVKLQDNCNNETTEVSNNETHAAVDVNITQTDPSVVSTDIDIADGKVNDTNTIIEGTDITYVPTAESQFPTETSIADPPSTTINPVAPPRRKRKDKKNSKKEDTQEVQVARIIDTNLPQVDVNVPCIKVSTSTTEMSHVLECGNSLDVVYNDDLLTRKSGGLSSTPASPTVDQSNEPGNLVRCNSLSGRQLTDEEILEQVVIKNLDTGETIPLSKAEEKLPECTNPLDLHIFRLATEQGSAVNDIGTERDDEDGHLSDTSIMSSGRMQDKRKKLKKFFGKTVQKIRSVADEVKARQREDSSSDEEDNQEEDGFIKFKHHRAIKDKLMFKKIKLLQDLSGEHVGAVWTMKFSICGKLLATAGQDNVVRVWVLKEYASHFEEMRLKYSRPTGRTSPTGSMTSSNSTTSVDDDALVQDLRLACGSVDDDNEGPFRKIPFVSYHGHTSDVLDLSWSKNFFLLSSSMDKTVRLWHISRQECLCCFQHVDFVTAICFHPKDDRYFLSGSLDGKIRLWNIPEKKVALWNEIDGSGTSLITAANFCRNGKLAVVGTFDGRCIFYDTDLLKYHTQVTVRSSRGKNARARKISGIEPMPGEDKVLITSNDSRIRLYDLKDHSLYCKYKGLQNESSQIKASFNNDGSLILCGSEDKFVHIWNTQHDIPNVRKDRNEYYESFSAHDAVVTATIFAPIPSLIINQLESKAQTTSPSASTNDANKEKDTTFSIKEHSGGGSKPFEVLVAADWQGGVKLYVNR